jgi:hypothetical protein
MASTTANNTPTPMTPPGGGPLLAPEALQHQSSWRSLILSVQTQGLTRRK